MDPISEARRRIREIGEARRLRQERRAALREARGAVRPHLVREYYSRLLGADYLWSSRLHRTYFTVSPPEYYRTDGRHRIVGYENSMMQSGNYNERVEMGLEAILSGMPFRLATGFTSSSSSDDEDDKKDVIVIEDSDDDDKSVISVSSDSTIPYADYDGEAINIMPIPDPISVEPIPDPIPVEPRDDIQCWQDEPEEDFGNLESDVGPETSQEHRLSSLVEAIISKQSDETLETLIDAVTQTEEDDEVISPTQIVE